MEDGALTNLASAEVYVPDSGTFHSTGLLTAARSGAMAAILPDGRILIAGGEGNRERTLTGLASAELFSPTEVPQTGPSSTNGSVDAFQVTDLELRADPSDFAGRCPIVVTFSGEISVAGGGGTVSYRWRSSDGTSSPI